MNRYLSILICAALSSTASAQTAMQLFNPAAKEFIYGNTPVASNLVEQALLKFPDDEKLQKLKKLIEEQQKNKDQQNQQKQDQQKKDDQKNQQQNKNQQKQDQSDPANQTEQDKNKQPPQQQNQQQASQPQQAGEMSEQEAQQLLDAMKQDEQDRRVNLKPFLGGPVRVEKDW